MTYQNPVCKICGDIRDHEGRPHSEAARESNDFLNAVRELAKPTADERPNLLLARTTDLAVGMRVYVFWGEMRGLTGYITGTQNGAYYIEPDGQSPVKNGGLHVRDAILRILDKPPAFGTVDEAEAWLTRSGEQEWFPDEFVRISEQRSRESNMKVGVIVKYLGIQGKEPPKYLVNISGEPKIVTSYFIKGRA